MNNENFLVGVIREDWVDKVKLLPKNAKELIKEAEKNKLTSRRWIEAIHFKEEVEGLTAYWEKRDVTLAKCCTTYMRRTIDDKDYGFYYCDSSNPNVNFIYILKQ